MKKILHLLFIVLFNQLLAQPIPASITFIGGSVYDGYADINEDNKIEFRLEMNDEIELYDGFDVKRIQFNNKPYFVYEYHFIKNKLLLLEVIYEGDIKAFKRDIFSSSTKKTSKQLTKELNKRQTLGPGHSYKASDGSNTFFSGVGSLKKIRYYLKKNKEPIVNIKSNFKYQAGLYFKDCPVLVNKIKSKEFLYTDMKLIVDYFNDFCTEL